jgi:hypothetical protein
MAMRCGQNRDMGWMGAVTCEWQCCSWRPSLLFPPEREAIDAWSWSLLRRKFDYILLSYVGISIFLKTANVNSSLQCRLRLCERQILCLPAFRVPCRPYDHADGTLGALQRQLQAPTHV